MKRVVLILITIILLTAATSCNQTTANAPNEKEDVMHVVCTIFPPYDWVKEIAGDQAEQMEITFLTNGIDLHSYQPSIEDMVTISNCDLLIYVGGVSEEWVVDALKEAQNPDMKVICLMDVVGDSIKVEEIIEGMEEEHEEELENEEANDEAHEEEYDEHIWLSLEHASLLCDTITKALSELDPDNAEEYQANLSSYTEELSAMNTKFHELVDTASVKTLLFGDRFPFRYFVDDYGLDYYAAFPGCSAETEASFETIIFLSQKIDELDLRNVIVIDGSDKKIASAIISETTKKDQQIHVLDAMQSVSIDDIESGITYLSIMESNYNTLTEVLK